LSGTVTFEKTWLEDYTIVADVYYYGGCCDSYREMWVSEKTFQSQKYTIKTLTQETKSFSIPINQKIDFVEGAGGKLLIEYLLKDKNGVLHELFWREYEFPESNSVCGDGINHAQNLIDSIDIYNQLQNELANARITIPKDLKEGTILFDPIEGDFFKDLKTQFYIETLNPTTGKTEVNKNIVFQIKTSKTDLKSYEIDRTKQILTIGVTKIIKSDNTITLAQNLIKTNSLPR
jgi:hypothetical protein